MRVDFFGKLFISQKSNLNDNVLAGHILNLCAQAKPIEVTVNASVQSLKLISADSNVIGRLDWSRGIQAHKVDSITSTFVLYTEPSEKKKSDCLVIRLLEPDSETRLYSDLATWQLDSVLQTYDSKNGAFRSKQCVKECRKGKSICETISENAPISERHLGEKRTNKQLPVVGSNKSSGSEDTKSDALSMMNMHLPSIKKSSYRLPRMVVLRGDFDENYIKRDCHSLTQLKMKSGFVSCALHCFLKNDFCPLFNPSAPKRILRNVRANPLPKRIILAYSSEGLKIINDAMAAFPASVIEGYYLIEDPRRVLAVCLARSDTNQQGYLVLGKSQANSNHSKNDFIVWDEEEKQEEGDRVREHFERIREKKEQADGSYTKPYPRKVVRPYSQRLFKRFLERQQSSAAPCINLCNFMRSKNSVNHGPFLVVKRDLYSRSLMHTHEFVDCYPGPDTILDNA
ncbi:unnamed protein product [Dibothriocephalus latus]|uniref:Uncharacterized protein n=1 Tax=Dibothriocephalus latus TaxID=60516 RepID=A0A3P6TNB3_DIBLA|nr:unnamed protein product [Dibothriocephalus latus]